MLPSRTENIFSLFLKPKFMLEFVENMLYLAFPRSVGGNESILWMWLDWGGFEVQKVQALHECLPCRVGNILTPQLAL